MPRQTLNIKTLGRLLQASQDAEDFIKRMGGRHAIKSNAKAVADLKSLGTPRELVKAEKILNIAISAGKVAGGNIRAKRAEASKEVSVPKKRGRLKRTSPKNAKKAKASSE